MRRHDLFDVGSLGTLYRVAVPAPVLLGEAAGGRDADDISI